MRPKDLEISQMTTESLGGETPVLMTKELMERTSVEDIMMVII